MKSVSDYDYPFLLQNDPNSRPKILSIDQIHLLKSLAKWICS